MQYTIELTTERNGPNGEYRVTYAIESKLPLKKVVKLTEKFADDYLYDLRDIDVALLEDSLNLGGEYVPNSYDLEEDDPHVSCNVDVRVRESD